jgi:hypothetical protein
MGASAMGWPWDDDDGSIGRCAFAALRCEIL